MRSFGGCMPVGDSVPASETETRTELPCRRVLVPVEVASQVKHVVELARRVGVREAGRAFAAARGQAPAPADGIRQRLEPARALPVPRGDLAAFTVPPGNWRGQRATGVKALPPGRTRILRRSAATGAVPQRDACQ